jgi:hypothetical protein
MDHLDRQAAADLIRQRSLEWFEHQKHWRWLYDSLEGGNRYRRADYMLDPIAFDAEHYIPWYQHGYDPTTSEAFPISYGQIVDRNLVPHLSETSGLGRDVYTQRLHRTPVPNDYHRGIARHLARVFAKEVRRESPDSLLTAWWRDVDGSGTPIDKWMRQTVGPLLLALGQLDLCFEHPPAPDDVTIATRADALAFGLAACTARVILPESVVWWELDPRTRRYEEVLIFERCHEEGVHRARWRHWTATDSNAYDRHGDWLPDHSYEHSFGCVPVVRVFDRRKGRCGHVGQGRYEEAAELQKSNYNRASELILSDIQQSHAQLMGPASMCDRPGQLTVGPGGVLPMEPINGGLGGYQEWKYLDPPKGAQAELRQHILDDQEKIDRIFCLQKPAGTNTRGAVAQSGVSKVMDDQSLVDMLTEDAEVLADAERALLSEVLAVLHDAAPDTPALAAVIEATTITYPKDFNLQGPSDVADRATEFAGMMEQAGTAPEAEKEYVHRHVTASLTGLDDATIEKVRTENDALIEAKAERRRQAEEGATLALTSKGKEGAAPAGDEDAEYPPGGESAYGYDGSLVSAPA